jgi:small redox-active disulfide protein 2
LGASIGLLRWQESHGSLPTTSSCHWRIGWHILHLGCLTRNRADLYDGSRWAKPAGSDHPTTSAQATIAGYFLCDASYGNHHHGVLIQFHHLGESMLTIKVLGPGCENCKKLAYLAERAVINLSIEAKIEKVTDYAEIMKYPILATPGLVLNERLVSSGRIPSEAEITTYLTTALMEQ